MVGLYGLIVYVAKQRTVEIGIRLALGADISRVVWLLLKQGIMLISFGLLLGVLASSALIGLIESMLYGVSPMDARRGVPASHGRPSGQLHPRPTCFPC